MNTLGPEGTALPVSAQQAGGEFRRLLDSLPMCAYTCDAGGLITYYNQQAVAVWGRAPTLNDPADRFCGSFNLYLPDGSPIPHDQCWMAKTVQTGRAVSGQEIIVERPDGRRLTVLAHATPLVDEAGRIVGAVNILVDITARKSAEQSQWLLAAIVESSDDAIVSKTLDGTILSWNSGAQRIFGYSPAEAVGRHITLIIPPDRHHEEDMILARLRRGERLEHYETIRRTKDGRLIDVSVTISPVRDSTGRIIAASKVGRDITAQKQAQQAIVRLKDELSTQLADLRRLHEMSRRLATTLELEPILDETLRTAAAIDGTDLGLASLSDPAGQCLRAGAKMGFGPEIWELMNEAPLGGGACGTSFQTGQRVVVEDTESDPRFAPYREVARKAGFRAVHSTPLVTRSGATIGVLSTHHREPYRPSDRATRLIDLCARQAVDFIENARLYAELQAADRSKDEFLAVLAHELRNPLAPIRNSLHLLRLSGELTPSAERVHEVMERQVNHLVRLVDDLLEVSRISRGKIELRLEEVELAAIIRSAVETSRPIIEEFGHQLAICLQPEPLVLRADAVRVAQIVSNLLNNAAKYTEPGGQIWLTVRRAGDEIVISVRDTGMGIPPEKIGRVFDMFAQIQPAGRRTSGGLGIGLALVKRLTEMHGGRIEARSEGPAKGSEFVVRLPLVEALQPPPDPALAPSQRPTPLAGWRILVVDDNRDAADSLGMFLKVLGAEVRTSYDGGAALAALDTFQPAVLLLDLGMPVMDGYEVARRVREHPRGSEILLIAMTGWGQEEDRRRTAEAGFNHHLVKPVDPLVLQDLLAASHQRPANRPSTSKKPATSD